MGIETAFPLLYTYLVKPGILSLERLIDLLTVNPRQRFGIESGDAFTLWDLNALSRIDPADFLSMGKSTPFTGWEIYGTCMATVCDGKLVYKA